MSEDLSSRILNWKFKDAIKYLNESDVSEEANVLRALSNMFGNIGWVMDGEMPQIIDFIVDKICPLENEDN